jgi:hypothetical protein
VHESLHDPNETFANTRPLQCNISFAYPVPSRPKAKGFPDLTSCLSLTVVALATENWPMAQPSAKAFSKVVETIYDCALDLRHWGEALRLVGDLTLSSNVAMGTMDYDQKRLVNAVEYGYDPA